MKSKEKSIIAVLGASNNPNRYSYKAVDMLKEYGFSVIPVHPSGISVCKTETKKSLADINSKVDTLSIYVNSSVSSTIIDEILNLNPRRIIFNPETENQALEDICQRNGIEIIHGCTLVMLRTNTF